MKIARVRTDYYRVPLTRPADDAGHGRQEAVELVTVVVETKSGAVGEGYAYTIGRGGRAVKALIDHDLIPLLLDKRADEPENRFHELWWGIHWVGRGGVAAFALAAIDIALWDLRARVAGLPLYRLLGGEERPIPGYGSGVDLSLSPDELVREVNAFQAEGFRAVKVKVGRQSFEEDLERIAAVREAIGPHAPLMVDANMRWNASEAIQKGQSLAAYGIAWLEEPLIPEDIAGHRKVKDALAIPIAAGENLHSHYEFHHYLQARALDIVQPDVVTVGGISEWLKVARLAEAHNLTVSTHYAEEIHVHLLAAIPNGGYCERHMFRLDAYLEQPLTVRDGHFVLPQQPGHGMRFNTEALAPYQQS